MSATALLQYVHQLHSSPTVPVLSTLPTLATLSEKAWRKGFVFAYAPTAAALGPSSAAGAEAVAALLHNDADAFLTTLLAAHWPRRTPDGLPLCAAGTCVLAVDEAGTATGEREYLIGTRYDLASTVFAMERYTVLTVPDTRTPSAAAPALDPLHYPSHTPTPAAAAAAAAAPGARAELAAMAEEQQVSSHRLRGAALGSRVGSAELTRAPRTSLADLSFAQRQQACVSRIVCRVISSTGGPPPDIVSAHRHLLLLSGAGVASPPPPCSAPAALDSRFYAFTQTATPFLGVSESQRLTAWQQLSEAGGGPRVCVPPSPTKGPACRTHNTTMATSTSALSEQGQSFAEDGGSRQPSMATTTGLGGREGSRGPLVHRGAAAAGSTDSSFSSSPAAHGNGVSVRWPAVGEDGPVGVVPLPVNDHHPHAARAAAVMAMDGESGGEEDGGSSTHRRRTRAAAVAMAALVPDLSPAALAARTSHVHWQLSAVTSLFARCPPYGHPSRRSHYAPHYRVTEGWQRWGDSCHGGLSRPLIVNSMDEIVGYCENSRLAFFSAVALLDYFVVSTAEQPAQVCAAFLNYVRLSHAQAEQQRRQQQQQATGGGAAALRVEPVVEPITEATDREMCNFFTQVICVCCMLGCKLKDTYPPALRRLLACLNSTSSDEGGGGNGFGEHEFTLLEVFVLQHVFQFEGLASIVTVREVVDLLLHLVGGDEVRQMLEFNTYVRLLRRQATENEPLAAQVAPRMARTEAGLQRSRADYLDALRHVAVGPLPSPVTKEEIREWHRLSLFARFVTDLSVRGPRSEAADVAAAVEAASPPTCDPAQRAEWERQATIRFQCEPLEFHPCTLGVAIVVVAAEVMRVVLPPPLFAVLPVEYQRALAEAQLAPREAEAGSRAGLPAAAAANEEAPWGGAAPACFPLRSCDDLYVVLAHFCTVLGRHTARTEAAEDSISGAGHCSSLGSDQEDSDDDGSDDEGASVGLNRAGRPARRSAWSLTQAIAVVKKVCREGREGGACDAIVRKRYRDMLAM